MVEASVCPDRKPIVDKVLAHLDEVVKTHGSVGRWLQTFAQTPEAYQTYVDKIITHFPPRTDGTSNVNVPGVQVFHPLSFNTHVNAGNKGLLIADDTRCLVTLMIYRGCLSDPTIPGVEMIVAAKVNPSLVPGFFPFDTAELPSCGGLALVKGWTRMVCLQYLLMAAVQLDLVRELMARDELEHSYCNIYTNVLQCETEETAVNQNRGQQGREGAPWQVHEE
jgi:hypothetical protein